LQALKKEKSMRTNSIDVAGVTIVSGPQVGDTSWSKEEYGL
jgi:hypothetical protein